MDALDKIITGFRDVVLEMADSTPKSIANEISNRFDCWNMSDREAYNDGDKSSLVRENAGQIIQVILALADMYLPNPDRTALQAQVEELTKQLDECRRYNIQEDVIREETEDENIMLKAQIQAGTYGKLPEPSLLEITSRYVAAYLVNGQFDMDFMVSRSIILAGRTRQDVHKAEAERGQK